MPFDLDLPLISAAILVLGVVMYVLLDGFDLGVGILYPFAPGEHDRDLMMEAVAPVWDGNETWLVLGWTALLAAFPIAYAVLLPAFYIPLLIMLVGLIFRGVCFEFRAQNTGSKGWWSAGFFAGSLAATLAQGVVLGTFIGGVSVVDNQYAGGPFAWATPFAALCAVGLAFGYALLGAGWIVLKTTGGTQAWAWRWLPPLALGVLVAGLAVSLWTPFLHDWVLARWFAWPWLIAIAPAPLVALGLIIVILQSARGRRHDRLPFLATLGVFLVSFFGLGVTLWPYVIPPAVTIHDAAAAPSSQAFVLIGLAVLLPVTLGYTAYSYRVFRGKVTGEDHY